MARANQPTSRVNRPEDRFPSVDKLARKRAKDTAAELDNKADKATQVIAGSGLTGGGDLSTDRTLAVGAGAGMVVNTDDVAIDISAEAERIRDIVGLTLIAGVGITITVNDAGDTITISSP